MEKDPNDINSNLFFLVLIHRFLLNCLRMSYKVIINDLWNIFLCWQYASQTARGLKIERSYFYLWLPSAIFNHCVLRACLLIRLVKNSGLSLEYFYIQALEIRCVDKIFRSFGKKKQIMNTIQMILSQVYDFSNSFEQNINRRKVFGESTHKVYLKNYFNFFFL